jgi:hypothetical protein
MTELWNITPCSPLMDSCLAYSSTLKMEASCSSETSLTFNGLHGIISQEIELSITTAVRTSHPTPFYLYCIFIAQFVFEMTIKFYTEVAFTKAHDNAERFYKRVQIMYLFVQYQPLECYFIPPGTLLIAKTILLKEFVS